ncbi:hypothetical protein QTP70_006533 [Hemibagrus guttatus]|uniref:Dipeptidylpeptidase IV N-terminal domain-containing protein n=1 Tax=Hemibagrus guttatus TaxID=175788 RepID=A0AAE0V8C6_9TELE|nr:hypothetical protein QTP70_006533 [Hemibagrus guttatus]KAK3568698.1 hypothetical protein QTP86_013450 [Hemibagrus guttatus]
MCVCVCACVCQVGQVNPTVKLNVVTLNGSSPTIELLPPSSLEKSEYYISMVRWVTEERVTVRWLNRAQNTSILTLCYTHTGKCERQSDGEVSVRHLTSGNWEVTKILAYDESLNAVYYISTEDGVSQRHLYRVRTVDLLHRECLTCSLFKPHCSYYDAMLSPDLQSVLLRCAGPGIPKTTVHQIANISSYMTVDSGLEFKDLLRQKNIPHREIRIISSNNHELLIIVHYVITNQYHINNNIFAYGGFLSSLLLLSHNSPFHCGVAMAPVSDWRLYGTTEAITVQ